MNLSSNAHAKHLLTSEYKNSFEAKLNSAPESPQSNPNSKLIVISIEKTGKNIPNIDVNCGSLYLTFEPVFLSEFLDDLQSVVRAGKTKQLSWSEIKNCISHDKILHYRNNKLNKMTEILEEDREFQVNFKASLFSVTMISMNGNNYLPLSQMLVHSININYHQYLKASKINVQMQDLSLNDLTNFPQTLTSFDLDQIVKKNLISGDKESKTLDITVILKDGLFHQVPEGDEIVVRGDIRGVSMNFQMVQTKRLLDYTMDVILPILLSKEIFQDVAWASPNYINSIYLNLVLGIWVRLDLTLHNCEVVLAKDQGREEIRVCLAKGKVTNALVRNTDRVLERGPSGIGIEDIISQDFNIALQGVSLLVPQFHEDQTLIRPIDLEVTVNLILGEGDYSLFYYTNPVTSIKNWVGEASQILSEDSDPLKKSILKYENSIRVDVNIGSAILELGNEEYLRIMRMMYKSIVMDDLHSDLYSANFELKTKLRIEQGILVGLHLGKSGVVFVDADKNPFGKLFIEGVDMGIAVHDSGVIEVKIDIDEIKGSFLTKQEGKLVEKGLVNQPKIIRELQRQEDFTKEIRKSLSLGKGQAPLARTPKLVFSTSRIKKSTCIEVKEEAVSRTINMEVMNNEINVDFNFLSKMAGIFTEEGEEDLEINKQKHAFKKRKMKYLEEINARVGRAGRETEDNLDEFTLSVWAKLKDNKFLVRNGESSQGLLVKGDIDLNMEMINRINQRSQERDISDESDLNVLFGALNVKEQFIKSGRMISKKKFEKSYVSGDLLGVSRFDEVIQKERLKRRSEEEKLELMYAILRNRLRMSLNTKVNNFEIFFEESVSAHESQGSQERKVIKPCKLFFELEQFEFFKNVSETQLKSTKELKSLTVSQMNIKDKIKSIRSIGSKRQMDFTTREVKMFQEMVFKGNMRKVVVDLSVKDMGHFNEIFKFQSGNLEERNFQKDMSDLSGMGEVEEQPNRTINIDFMIYESILVNLINDHQGVLNKNFTFLFRSFSVLGEFTDIISLIVRFSLEAQYFNGPLYCWEPCVENSKFIFELEQSYETHEEQLSKILQEKREKEDDIKQNSSDLRAIKEIESERSIFEKKVKDFSERDIKINIKESMTNFSEEVQSTRRRTICRVLQGMDIEEPDPSKGQSGNQQILNINVTIELLKQMKLFLSSMEDILKEKTEEVQPQVIEAPFKIRNVSGYPVRVNLMKEEYLLTRECKLQKKKLLSRNYQIGENETLDVFDDFDSYFFKKSNNKMHMNFVTSISFEVEHPEYPKWKSEGLSVASQTFRQLSLINKDGLKNEILYLSSTKSSSQEIFIGSSVEVINRIPAHELNNQEVSIQVKFKQKEFRRVLGFNENLFIPFDMVTGEMAMKLQEEDLLSANIKLTHFKLQNHGHLTPFEYKKDGKHFVVRYERDLVSFFQLKFIMLPVFEVVNYLPFRIEIFLSNSKLRRVIPLEPGQIFKTCQYTIHDDLNFAIGIPIQSQESSQTAEEENIKTFLQHPFSRYHMLSEFKTIINKKQEYQKINFLQLETKESSRSYAKIIKRESQQAAFSFVITCDMIIINETPYTLDIRGCDTARQSKRALLPQLPQERICLMSSVIKSFEVKLSDCHKDNMRFFSKKFTSKILAGSFEDQALTLNLAKKPMKNDNYRKDMDNVFPVSQNIKDRYTSLEIGCYVDYLENRKGFGIKTFLLGAKTIIVNESACKLFLSQSYSIEVAPHQRKPIYIFKGKNAKDKMFIMKMEKNGVMYSSEVPLDFNSFGSVSIYLLNREEHKYIIVRFEVMLEKGYTFIKFEDRTGKRDLVFKNNLGVTVCVFQRKFEKSWYVVLAPREEGEICWVDPYKTKELKVQIYIMDKKNMSRKEIKSQRETIRPKTSIHGNLFSPLTSLIFESPKVSKSELGKPYDQFNIVIERIRKKVFKTSKGKEILINVRLQGSSRVVMVETVRRNIEESVQEEVEMRVGSKDVFTVIVHFKQIGVSFVESFGKYRKELFYFLANEVNLFGETEEQNLNCQLQIRYLNLDNNFSNKLPFEVGMTTSEPLASLQKNNHYMVNVIFNVKERDSVSKTSLSGESIICFDEITVEISPLVLRLDSESLVAFEIMGKQIFGIFSDSSLANDLCKYYNPQDKLMQMQWKGIALHRVHWIYCKNFSVSLLKTIVTYRKVEDNVWTVQNQGSDLNGIWLSSLKSSLPNFDDSPLNFKGIELFYVFESSNGLLSLYLQHLKMQWKFNMMKLVGSLNILGNPTNLFGNVGNGMVQFVEKPVQGFKKGPLGAVKGGIYGSKALLQNTTVGVMSAVSKFTGSLASGFSTLTQDKEFDRNRHTTKPKNTLTGMKNGAKSIGKGLWSGATGIFTQPVKGMKKSGAKGFMKGIFKGITGVVTKPVSGILDAASQTTQGVSGSLTKKSELPNEERFRPPRILFSRARIIREYHQESTEVFWKATAVKSSIGRSYLVGTFNTTIKLPKQEMATVVVITAKNLFCFSEKMDKILLVVSLNCIINFISNINEARIEISSRAQSQIIELQIVCLVSKKTITLILMDKEETIVKMIKLILTAKYFS